LKRGDFSTCDAPRPGRPKTETSLEINDQIHKLLLEDSRISVKSIAEQLGIWHGGGLGSSFVKIWTGGSSQRSGCPNDCTWIKNFNGASRLSNFWKFFGVIQIFSCRGAIGYQVKNLVISQWTGNKQQSMEWRHSASHQPKNSECKNPLETFSPRCFGIKMASSLLIIVQRTKLSTQNINHFCWCKLSTFEGKTPREFSQEGLVVARHSPGSPGTYQPEETGLPGFPMSWSPTLSSGSGPVGIPPVLWTEKGIEIRPFFFGREGHCCRGDLVSRTIFWHFLSGLQKLEQRVKKCIELRGGYVE